MGATRNFIAANLLLGALFAASAATAATPIVVADAGKPGPRFMSLSSARSPLAGVQVIKPLRSDRAALQSGFMRIDRARDGGIRIQRTHTVAALPIAKQVIIPAPEKEVLALFGDEKPVDETFAPKQLGHVQQAWPLPASVRQELTSGYGPRKDPFNGQHKFHDGIDLAAPAGTAILASADGVVSDVGRGGGFGKYVRVRHRDGSESTYGHLSAQSVHVGQSVHQGQRLGALGSTGRSTGPHLHYAISRNDDSINPLTVLRQPSALSARVASNIIR